jgi:hypothetical protein
MNTPPNFYTVRAHNLADAIAAAEAIASFAGAIQQTLIACSHSKVDPFADNGDPMLELRLPTDTALGLGALVSEIANRIDTLEAHCCRRRP